MHSNLFLRSFRILLFPFALIFWIVVLVRNWFYDKGFIRSASFGLPIICVGNLAVGGTGKSPMVEFLVSNLKDRFRVATLSRGYKRKTKGYALANENSTALEIGDEPMQFHVKFPDVAVAVGEERLVAIPQLLHDHPETECIILDDAFQHRAIKAGLNILLTDYNNLFTRDFFLPTGDLRDLKKSYKRADIIIVTKCIPELTLDESEKITEELKPLMNQSVYFTANQYSNPYHIVRTTEMKRLTPRSEILLITGVANPTPIKELLDEHANSYDMMHFADHHIFSIDDWKEIKKRFSQMETKEKFILTTEKDAMRLLKFGKELYDIPLYVLPLTHKFLFDQGPKFVQEVSKFISKSGIRNKIETVNT